MIFSSPTYFLFFAAVFTTYWFLIPSLFTGDSIRKAKHFFLLIVSYFFYLSWDWRFGLLMAFSTSFGFAMTILIDRSGEDGPGLRRRNILLALSVIVNLGILGYFKYVNFFIESFVDLINFLQPGTFNGLQKNSLLLNIILPIGISFYTFESISYTVDVYRKIMPVERSLIRFALFISFFPHLVAGPIVMAKDFLPQLDRDPAFDLNRIRTAARWFALGYFKKAVIADNISPVVDMVYSNPSAYGAIEHWLAAFGFYMQIYGDFSGYSDMAWGSAIALGYDLPENFRMPFLSRSFTEFWQRWHMSLLKWIRDYVYIPLGGNRVSSIRHKFNIIFTMFVSGLWHGANWTYIVWGILHGAILALEYSLKRRSGKEIGSGNADSAVSGSAALYSLFHKYAMPVLILILGAYFTTIFRSDSMSDSVLILIRMIGLDDFPARIPSLAEYRPVILGTATILIGHLLGKMILEKKMWGIDAPAILEIALLPFIIIIFTQIAATDVEAFIYFVF